MKQNYVEDTPSPYQLVKDLPPLNEDFFVESNPFFSWENLMDSYLYMIITLMILSAIFTLAFIVVRPKPSRFTHMYDVFTLIRICLLIEELFHIYLCFSIWQYGEMWVFWRLALRRVLLFVHSYIMVLIAAFSIQWNIRWYYFSWFFLIPNGAYTLFMFLAPFFGKLTPIMIGFGSITSICISIAYALCIHIYAGNEFYNIIVDLLIKNLQKDDEKEAKEKDDKEKAEKKATHQCETCGKS